MLNQITSKVFRGPGSMPVLCDIRARDHEADFSFTKRAKAIAHLGLRRGAGERTRTAGITTLDELSAARAHPSDAAHVLNARDYGFMQRRTGMAEIPNERAIVIFVSREHRRRLWV